MNAKMNPLSLIKGQLGMAQWKLLQQTIGVVDECEDPNQATLALEAVKGEALVDQEFQAGVLPLASYAPLYGNYLQKLSGDKYQPGTVETRLRHLKSVADYWPDYSRVPIAALEPANLQSMRPTMRQEMAFVNGQPPSKNTLNTYSRVVSYLIGFLVGLGVMDLMRALLLMRSIGYAKPSKRKVPTATPEQEELMRQYLTETWWHTSYQRAQIVIVFEIFMTYGIREEMFTGLLVEHVDLVNRQIMFTLNKQSCEEIKTRTLRIPESLAAKLAEFITRHQLLPGQRLVTVNSIDRSLKTAALKAGLANWHPHACRHYVGTKLLRDGVGIAVVAWLLGHKDGGVTLLRHYLPDDFTADANRALEMQDLRKDFDVDEQFWFARQLPLLINFVKRLESAPKPAAKSIIKHLHLMDRYVRSQDFGKAIALAGAAQDPRNPLNCTPKTIYIPKSYNSDTRNILAANVRTLMTRAGQSVNSLTVTLGIGRDSLYALLSAKTLNETVLQKLAAHFKLTRKQLTDPAMPEINWDRVFNNVQLLVERYGITNIPCPTQIGRFLNGRELPSGSALKALADYANVDFGKLLDVELVPHTDLIKRPLPVPEPSRAENAVAHARLKENFQANLKLGLLNKGVTLVGAAAAMQIRLNQLNSYSAGQDLPPADRLRRIAEYLGKTPEQMLVAKEQPKAADVGQLVARLLKPKHLPLWKAARHMHIGMAKLQQIFSGQELPNGPQLHRIATYLGVTPESLLGITPQSLSEGTTVEPAMIPLESAHLADAKIAA